MSAPDVEELLDAAVSGNGNEEVAAQPTEDAAKPAAPPEDGRGEGDGRDRDRRDGRDRGDRERDRERDRRRDHRDDDRDRRDSGRDRRDRHREPDFERRGDRDRRDRRDDDRDKRDKRDGDDRRRRRSRSKSVTPDPAERERQEAMRDDLTVLVQRIHPRADDFEIFEFFSQAGKVRDIRLIRDQRSNKSKGVGYVEYADAESVMKALALNGIAFKGQPLLVQASMAEKNRLAQAAKNVAAASAMMGGGGAAPGEPTKLLVSELHPALGESDVSEVLAPFGEIAELIMPLDPLTGERTGVAHVTYVKPEDARTAQEAIHGLELVGKCINVQFVQEAPPPPPQPLPNALPNMMPNMMQPGAAMGMAGMAGMGAMGTMGMPMGGVPGMPGMVPGMVPGMMPGMVPGAMAGMAGMPGMAAAMDAAPGVVSRFVLMKNMFDPEGADEKDDPDFFDDLREDIRDEAGKHGEVAKCVVLPQTAGHIVLAFDDEAGAAKCVTALNQRWFAGKQISVGTIDEATFEASLPARD